MMPQRTQQSTTANQRVVPSGDRGDLSLVGLYNSKWRNEAPEKSVRDTGVWSEPGAESELGMRMVMIQITEKSSSFPALTSHQVACNTINRNLNPACSTQDIPLKRIMDHQGYLERVS